MGTNEIAKYIENLVELYKDMVNIMCLCEEIQDRQLFPILNNLDEELTDQVDMDVTETKIFEQLAKCFAKKAEDRMVVDLDTGEMQDAVSIINKFVEYCDKHNWFEEEQ